VVAPSVWRHDREVVLDKQQLPDYGIDVETGYQKVECARSSLYLLQNAANLSSKQAPNLQSSFSEIFWASRRLAAREKKTRLSNRMPTLAAAHKQYSRMILKGKYAQDQISSTRTGNETVSRHWWRRRYLKSSNRSYYSKVVGFNKRSISLLEGSSSTTRN
jgi:hypothetical protein